MQEDEIDLRPYIEALLRRWKLIAGITLASAAIAAGLSLSTPHLYESTSTVAIASFGTKPVPDAKAYVELATRQDVLVKLSRSIEPSFGRLMDARELTSKLKATPGVDPSLVNLRVTDESPEQVAEIANSWSELFVDASNSTFNPAKHNYEQLQGQLTQARQQLVDAQKGLVDVELSTRLDVLQVEMASQRNTLAGLYAGKVTLRAAQENATSILSRLRQLAPATPASPSDDASITMIQASVLGAPIQVQLSAGSESDNRVLMASGQSAAVQLQLPEGGNRTLATQIVAVEGILAMVRDRTQEADNRIETLKPAILESQMRVSQAEASREPLLTRRDGLRQTAKDLELKASQAKAAVEAKSSQVHAVAEAQAPMEALGRGTARNTAMAAILGLVFGVAAAFGREYAAARLLIRPRELQPLSDA